MDPVLNRQMFQGGSRPPQQPGGKGIVGLVEDDAPAKAMTAVAGSVDKFEQGVDGAQNYEQLMNAVRGNEQPIEARYAELAKVVGMEDAQATPESVLAVAQPALELLSGKGIEALAGVAGMGQAQAPQPPVQGFAEGGSVTYSDSYHTVRPQTGYDQDYAAYAERLDRILGPRANLQEEVAKRKALFAEDDTSSFDANLALMKYGAQVANTPGGILPALTKPAGDLASDLSKVANKRADISRGVKVGALGYVDDDKKMHVNAHVGGLKSAFDSFQEDRRLAMKLNSEKKTRDENAMKGVTVIMNDGSEKAAIQRGTVLYDPNTQIPLTGVARIKDDSGAGGKPSAQSFMIKDDKAPGGYRAVLGQMGPDGTYAYEAEPGKFVAVDARTAEPGKYEDFFKVTTDDRGRTKMEVLRGPETGKIYRKDSSGSYVKSQETSDLVNPMLPKPVAEAAAAHVSADPGKPEPIGAFDVKGPQSVFLSVGKPAYTKGERVNPQEEADHRLKISQGEDLLRSTEEVLKAVPNAVGMKPTAKSFIGHATGSLGFKFAVDPANEAQRAVLDTYTKQVQQFLALNPRFAVSEQDLLKDIAGNPTKFWRDPELAFARIQELARQASNDMEVRRATLENRSPLILEHIPQGTPSERFDARNPKHKYYLEQRAAQGDSLVGVNVIGKDGKPYTIGE